MYISPPEGIQQEEWVQLWLTKLSPAQKSLVVEILKEFEQRRQSKVSRRIASDRD